jgi:tetratricopeptide (TPR) repeat protein
MTIEIEIKSSDAFTDIYELRNLIQELEIEGLQIKLKEQAPMEGTMSVGFMAVAGIVGAIVGETALKTSLEVVFQHTLKSLEPAFKKFLKKVNHHEKSNVEIYTEMSDDAFKKSYITNSNGETTILNHPNFAIDVKRTKAILIGNSEFDFTFPAIQPVKGNIQDLYNLLIDKKIVGLPAENIIVLLDKSSGEIEEQLILASKLPNVETILIYYAGHGCRTDKSKLYLIAKNTKKIDDHIINGIDFDFIKNVILKQSTASQKILILDACHSGIATQGVDDIIAGFNVAGTYTFASSSPNAVSFYNPEKNNTFFTGEIINTLSNGLDNNKENIALEDIYQTVAFHLKEKNFPEPHFKSELTIKPSDFYIAHNPKFSIEAWVQKATKLHHNGRLDEACHEYHLLVERFPEDKLLQQALDDCYKDKKFLVLVNEADVLFKNKIYGDALKKYDEALQVKYDFITQQNRNKCEQFFEIWKQISEDSSTTGRNINDHHKIADAEKDDVLRRSTMKKKQEKEILPPKPIAHPGNFKKWIYFFCSIISLFYFLLLPSMIPIFSCESCALYLKLMAVGFLLLIPFQVALFLWMKKPGWIISLFTSIFQIIFSLRFIVMRVSMYESDGLNYYGVVAVSAMIIFTCFTIFLLQKRTIQSFRISKNVLKSALIVSGVIVFLYFILQQT